jgi:hypothetical protein
MLGLPLHLSCASISHKCIEHIHSSYHHIAWACRIPNLTLPSERQRRTKREVTNWAPSLNNHARGSPQPNLTSPFERQRKTKREVANWAPSQTTTRGAHHNLRFLDIWNSLVLQGYSFAHNFCNANQVEYFSRKPHRLHNGCEIPL